MATASNVTTFTLESDAVQGDGWRESIDKLVALERHCKSMDLARTTGARREAESGQDVEAAERRTALLEGLPEITETGVYGVSRFGESTFGGDRDHDRFEKIKQVLWPKKSGKPNLSETNDAMHLDTPLKHGRVYFVTTDQRILCASEGLAQLGIKVLRPDDALALAVKLCAESSE